jgi:hypothetical protein
MVVRGPDGKKLGRVLACREESFVVEKGFFFAVDYVAHYEDVTDVSGGEIQLARPREELPRVEHAFTREGALGESFTLGVGGGLETSPLRSRGADEEGGALRGEDERGLRCDMGEPSRTLPPSYGDEGGGGL